MTGPEHYQEAEDCIDIAITAEAGSCKESFHLALGQLHATLAQAAALNIKDFDAWRRVAGAP